MSADADLLARAREIDLLASLRTNSKGLIEASISNLCAFLRAETRWRIQGEYALYAQRGKYGALINANLAVMRTTLEQECGFARIGAGNFKDALLYVASGGK